MKTVRVLRVAACAGVGFASACSSQQQPANAPPQPAPQYVAPVQLAPPAPAPPSVAAPVPSGWVNYGGIVLPAIPGVTTPAAPTGTKASAFLPGMPGLPALPALPAIPGLPMLPLFSGAPTTAAATTPPAPASTGWVTLGGIQLPAIPGLTVPPSGAPGGGGPAPSGTPASAFQGGCGHAELDGFRIPLDCVTAGYAEIPWASMLALSRSTLGLSDGTVRAAATLPPAVDHRADKSEGPIRNQGRVGACTAFSFSSAVDHAYARANSGMSPVSVMHVWARYHLPNMESAASNNLNRNLTTETNWAYDEKTACSWSRTDEDCREMLGVQGSTNPDPARVSAADAAASVKISGVTRIDGDSIKEALAKGRDVWFAMYIDGAQFSKVRGSQAVVPNGDFRITGSGHAMLLAGYNTQSDGTYYLIHNSWGTRWGDNGYAWIREDTLKRNLKSAYLIDVAKPGQATPTPTGPSLPSIPPQPPAGACSGGYQADSVLGVCLPVCPDGSPRTLNMCVPTSGCPQGYVNVFGMCVVAAPVASGADTRTGIRYSCGPGGCNYLYPQGQGNCPFALCAKSCPAPMFHLTFGALGVGCSD